MKIFDFPRDRRIDTEVAPAAETIVEQQKATNSDETDGTVKEEVGGDTASQKKRTSKAKTGGVDATIP